MKQLLCELKALVGLPGCRQTAASSRLQHANLVPVTETERERVRACQHTYRAEGDGSCDDGAGVASSCVEVEARVRRWSAHERKTHEW